MALAGVPQTLAVADRSCDVVEGHAAEAVEHSRHAGRFRSRSDVILWPHLPFPKTQQILNAGLGRRSQSDPWRATRRVVGDWPLGSSASCNDRDGCPCRRCGRHQGSWACNVGTWRDVITCDRSSCGPWIWPSGCPFLHRRQTGSKPAPHQPRPLVRPGRDQVACERETG